MPTLGEEQEHGGEGTETCSYYAPTPYPFYRLCPDQQPSFQDGDWEPSVIVFKMMQPCGVCCFGPVIPLPGRQKQEDFKFEASLGNLLRSCLELKKKKRL